MSILRLKDENGNWQDVPAIIGPQGEPGADGQPGADGKSAYQIWLDAGNTGTEADFLASLVGPQGPEGKPGEDGETPDLSGYVQTVNKITPDGDGNVDIELPIKVIDNDFLNSIDYYKNNNKLNISSIFAYGGMGLYSVQEPFVLEGIPDTNLNKDSIVYIIKSNYAITIPTDRSIIIFIANGGMYTLDMTHKYMSKLVNMNYLPTNNFDAYTPTSDYNPATKKYVDNAVTTALGDIESLLSEV